MRATLFRVKTHDADRQNVTLSLSRPLLRKAKILAVERQTSLSGLLAGALEDLVKGQDEYEKAKERALSYMRNARNLGTGGRITWTRDSLHERR
jgi:3',5'-cyclic AMP phosphodiesterase CpdA